MLGITVRQKEDGSGWDSRRIRVLNIIEMVRNLVVQNASLGGRGEKWEGRSYLFYVL